MHKAGHRVPRSKMARPRHLAHWPRFVFWQLATPLHPLMRTVSLKLGLVNFNQFLDRKGRQKYLFGTIAPNHTADALIQHLTAQGYGENVVAWKDDGEIASLRLPDGFRFQYHVRIFSDGEVRGHYEYTPEAHPRKHYYEVDMEERREYFLELFGERITPA